MHQFHIPQCTIQNKNVRFSVLNDALWDMRQVHCGICEIGPLTHFARWRSSSPRKSVIMLIHHVSVEESGFVLDVSKLRKIFRYHDLHLTMTKTSWNVRADHNVNMGFNNYGPGCEAPGFENNFIINVFLEHQQCFILEILIYSMQENISDSCPTYWFMT